MNFNDKSLNWIYETIFTTNHLKFKRSLKNKNKEIQNMLHKIFF